MSTPYRRPSLIERDEALAAIGKCLIGTDRVFHDAFVRVRTTPNELDLIDRDVSCQAKMVQCYAVQGLVRLWAGNTRVRFMRHGQQDFFLIDHQYAVRVKKMDAASRTAPNDTKQDRSFRGQLSFEGIGQINNFELGWVPNALETEILDVRLSCVNGRKSPYWWHSIATPADNVYDLFQGKRPEPSAPGSIKPIDDGQATNDGVTIKPKET